jgi:hypothetical protein
MVYQVSVHLAAGFQRRKLKCEKLTDDRRRTPSDGKSSLWQGELKTDHTKKPFPCLPVSLTLRVECTLFCNLQSWVRTHAVLVIGLYELLGNPTT